MTGSNIIKDLMEFKEFLGKLKTYINELDNYCDLNYGLNADITVDIAKDVKDIIEEDIINDKREYDNKVKSIVRLYHVVDFVYGFTFNKDEFSALSKIMLDIMTLIEDYGFLDE